MPLCDSDIEWEETKQPGEVANAGAKLAAKARAKAKDLPAFDIYLHPMSVHFCTSTLKLRVK